MALETGKIQLPREVVTQMITKVGDNSVIAQLSPSTPQLFKDTTHLIFSPTAEAEVVSEGASKTSYEQNLTQKEAIRVKLQTTTRVSNELQWADEDDKLEIVTHIIDDQTKALARAIDYVIIHGTNPATGSTGCVSEYITQNATSVSEGSVTVNSLDKLAEQLLDYEVNGLALSRKFASQLRQLRAEGTGARLYSDIPLNLNAGQVEGLPCVTSNNVNGALCNMKAGTTVRAIMGDFSLIKWGMVRDVFSELIEYGDPDGTGIDLKNVNQVAYRTESMFAYAILDPQGFAYLDIPSI